MDQPQPSGITIHKKNKVHLPNNWERNVYITNKLITMR